MGTAKIVVSLDGTVMQELELSKDRITIGRRPYNDVILNSPSISGEHAMITTMLNECVLEDLNSTNGTYVNGQPVKKHFLQNNDVIELVKFRIQYFDGKHTAQVSSSAASTADAVAGIASLLVLNGANAEQALRITKDVTTLGRAGVQVATISRTAAGFMIAQVEGPSPLVNGQAAAPTGHTLFDGDVIDLSGTQIEFSTR